MRTLLSVLPLAFVMIAGPQIISAVFLATSLDWRRSSAAFLAGALSSITIVVSAAYFLTRAAKGGDSSSASGTTGHVIDAVVLVLLLVLAVYVFHSRKKSEPPKWMGKLQSATPSLALKLGFLLLGVYPPTSSRRSRWVPTSRARVTPGGTASRSSASPCCCWLCR